MYQHWVERMEKATSAKDRSRIVAEMGQRLGRPTSWVYRTLAENGWQSGRKTRSDAGSTKVPEESLKAIAAMVKAGVRKNGKATVHLPLAKHLAEANGIPVGVTAGRLAKLMRDRGQDAKSQKRASPAQRMRSLHPNHVHLVDPSVALIYYLPDGGQEVVDDSEVYKNKPWMVGKEHLKVQRYVLVDHYSGSVCVRYYQAAGETTTNLWDFLLYAWGPKADPAYAFHGLPELLLWDSGSANTSKAITQALKSLRVETLNHMPGNPRAKGAVEKANDLIECGLESRLRFEPVDTLDELNALAERYCAAFNANGISGIDCRLTRNGRKIGSRLALWQHISVEQLREIPEPEVCRALLTQGPVQRSVNGSLSFTFDFPRLGRCVYQLYGQPGISVGSVVQVQPLLVEREGTVVVSWKHDREILSVEVNPLEFNEQGLSVDGAVIGQGFKAIKDTPIDAAAKELTTTAFGTEAPKKDAVPFASFDEGRGLKAHSFIDTAMDIKPARKVGTQVAVTAADVVAPHEIRRSVIEALKAIKARVGWLPENYKATLEAEYPDGVPVNIIDDIAEELKMGSGEATRFIKEA